MADPQKIFDGSGYVPLRIFTGPGYQPAKECCCEPPPEECCLYPWPDPDGILGGPYYPDTDLPNPTIILNLGGTPITMTKVSGYRYEGSNLGIDYYIAANPGTDNWDIGTTDSEGTDEPFSSGPCLIADFGGGDSVEDEFPDTLTFDFDDGLGISGSISITRISLCVWEGTGESVPDGYPVYAKVEYSPALAPLPYKWYGDWTAGGFGGSAGVKDDPQNTPIGDYTADVGTMSVAP